MLETDTIINSPSPLQTTMGEKLSLSANNKTLVLYFFAPWCSVCHASIDNLQQLFVKNEQFDVIPVALDYTKQQEVLDFAKQHQLTFPIVYGNEKNS